MTMIGARVTSSYLLPVVRLSGNVTQRLPRIMADMELEFVQAIDTEEAENTERISHRDTKTQRISVSPCLGG
jgi:hypothetical protein